MGKRSWCSWGPISSVQRPSLRTRVHVSSVPTLPVLDARTAGARCPSPAECSHSWHLYLPCPQWRTKERAAWGDPAPDPIGAASCWLLLQPASNKPVSRVLLVLISFILYLSVYASPSFMNVYLPSQVQGLSAKCKDPTFPAPRDLTLQITKVTKPHMCTGYRGLWHRPRALEYSRCLRTWPPLTTSVLFLPHPLAHPHPKSQHFLCPPHLCMAPHTPAQVPLRPHRSTPRASPQEPFPLPGRVFTLPLCPRGSLGTLVTHSPCAALATLGCNGF